MAVSCAEGSNDFQNTSNTTSYAMAPFTPSANALIVVFVAASDTTATGSMTGGSLTWARLFRETYNTTDSLYCFWAKAGASPSSTTPTFACTGDAASGVCMFNFQFTGTNLAVRQYKSGTGSTANPSLTLDAAMQTGNAYCAGFAVPRNPPSSTPPSNWTEICDDGWSSPTGGGTGAYRVGGETGTTITFTSASASWAMGAVEVWEIPAPTVTSCSPDSGSIVGGTSVTVTGTNFVTGCTGTLDGTSISPSFTNSTTVTFTTPRNTTPGAKNLVITNPDTQTSGSTGNSAFTYTGKRIKHGIRDAVPALSALNYSQGDTLGGGQSIVITGTGLSGASDVKFGSTSASSFTVDSSTQITATLPAHAAGAANVTVVCPGGTSNAQSFAYWDPSQLTSTTIFCEDYTGGNWSPRAGSVSGDLDDVSTVGLSVGTGAGGFTSAQFVGGSGNSGRFQSSVTPNYIDSYQSQQSSGFTAGVVWALCKPVSSEQTFSPASPYTHRAIIGTNAGGYLIFGHTNNGFFGNVYDGTYEGVSAPCTLGTGDAGTGAWHMIVYRYTTTVSQISVDGSALASASTAQDLSVPVGTPYLLQIGTDYSGTVQFGGELLAFGLTKADGSDTDVTKLRNWAMQRFGVTV